MRKEIWDECPRICHYTRFYTVTKILESKEIWATLFSQLNDTSEFYYSSDLISQAVHQKIKAIDGSEHLTIEEIKKLCHDNFYVPFQGGWYLTSFCKLNDQPKENDGILSMWRSYANDGCYIEFDSKLIYKNLELKSDCQVNMVFDEVFYHGFDERQQEYEKLANMVAEKTINLTKGKKDPGIIVPFFKLAPMLKHPGFHEEKEVRLAILNSVKNVRDTSFPVKQNCLGKDYISLPIDTKSITKIVIGPNKAQKYQMDEIRRKLQHYEEYKHVEVICSTIPYRDWN